MWGAIIVVGALTLLLIGVAYMLRRFWDEQAQMTPEEEAYDKRVARLNQRQANRISDGFLRRNVSDDDAWQMMVRRGRRSAQGQRQREERRRTGRTRRP